MTDREILEKILNRLDTIEHNQMGMQTDIVNIKQTQTDMQTDITNIKQTQTDMQTDITNIKQTQADMQTDISNIKKAQTDMQTDISNIKNTQTDMQTDISSIKMTLENDIAPKLDDLYSLYLSDSQRFQTLEKQVQENTDNIAINSVIRDIKIN